MMPDSSLQMNAVKWPDIVRAPRKPLRAAVAKWLMMRVMGKVAVSVVLPDGKRIGDESMPTMRIHSEKFFHRLGADLKIGLGESYMAGEWSTDADLADVLTPFAERLLDIVPAWMRRFRAWVEPRQPHLERNDRRGARSNISRHYDLSNDLFKLFLDSTMTYSSAWFDGRPTEWEQLAEAQMHKVDGVLDYAKVTAGTNLLEIGSGWGQLALQAAGRGANVHTITLSTEQRELAMARIAEAGLSERVDVELRDYRDLEREYDAAVSVEMIEAVGEEFWDTYFASVAAHLRKGGVFGLQAITMPHDRMLASRHAYSWVHKYIFPGGLIPSVEAIEQSAQRAGLTIRDSRSFGLDYGHTLRLWRRRFDSILPEVNALGFDSVFVKMWDFYLAYSEAGFRAGHLNVYQFALERN